jgi:hypothetical protein
VAYAALVIWLRCLPVWTARLYKPIWEYDAKTLAEDLTAHLVYGFATATAMRLLSAIAQDASSSRE